ncbi:MAG: cytochrome b/b6 domain-containing protein [Rhodobacteraceae bacterium]|nr:cytochrome b/b6 domain-containing protein [Paracoccaceae bacterium]
MARANTATHYGSVARTFHWLTALLILTAMPLGVIANGIPIAEDTIAQKTLLFSLHKTVGIAAFFVALARIVWAIAQPKPVALHPDRRAETWLAELMHWMLYGSLVLVPLTGWLHHAATTGFAPIWWPFGQSLPFVPVDFRVAEYFSALHWLFTKVLLVAILMHIAGALKHVFVDRDVTLTRMTTGNCDVDVPSDTGTHRSPAIAATIIWLAALGAGSWMGLSHESDAGAPVASAAPAGEWLVEDGTLAITIRQLGSEVTGSFGDWAAGIRFDPEGDEEIKGDVFVDIVIGSLELGTVTDQAKGPDFFDTAVFPTASYTGPIIENPNGDGYLVQGLLTIRDASIPVDLPFTIVFEGDTATADGSLTLDRRDFGVGDAYTDEGSLAFAVDVTVSLTATRLEF